MPGLGVTPQNGAAPRLRECVRRHPLPRAQLAGATLVESPRTWPLRPVNLGKFKSTGRAALNFTFQRHRRRPGARPKHAHAAGCRRERPEAHQEAAIYVNPKPPARATTSDHSGRRWTARPRRRFAGVAAALTTTTCPQWTGAGCTASPGRAVRAERRALAKV